MNRVLIRNTFLSIFIIVILFFYLLFCLHEANFTLAVTLGLVIVTIFLLTTGLMMEYLSVTIFMALIMILKIAPAPVTFSGFVSDGFWLIFAGMPISMALKQTGLADRISRAMTRVCCGGYLLLVCGMTLFGVVMAFIMPSAMSRTLIMVPILIEFAKVNGFPVGTKGYNGLIIAGMMATYIAGFAILPSNLPNLILLGSVKSLYHIDITYAHYLLYNFPVLAVVKLLLLISLICLLFTDSPQKLAIAHTHDKQSSDKFSFREKKLTLYLMLLLVTWLSDSLTHLSPAWPALIAAVICLLPRVGVLDQQKFIKSMNVGPLIYVGGLIGLSAVVSHTGLGSLLGDRLIKWLPLSPGHNLSNYFFLSLLSMVIGMVTTLPGVPAVITPLSSAMVNATHLSLHTVLMTQVVGFSMVVLPYQAPPLLIGLRLANLSLMKVSKLCLLLTALSIIILIPLNYYWWQLVHSI